MPEEGLRLFRSDEFGEDELSAMEVFLTGIPPVGTFNCANGTIEAPAHAISERLKSITDSVSRIACARSTIAFQGSVLREAYEADPSILDSLDELSKQQVLEIISRIAIKETDS